MEARIKKRLKEIGREAISFDVPMSRHTTFRVGGAVEALYRARNLDELKALMAFLWDEGIPYLVVGKGSNLLVRDGGLPGVAILLEGSFAFIEDDPWGEPSLAAGAGVPLHTLVDYCTRRGLSGVEFLAGIPGTVGGGVTMNAGSWGKEMSGVASGITVLTTRGTTEEREGSRLSFTYRGFDLKGEIVLDARLNLKADKPASIREKVAAYRKRRKERFPLDMACAGSIFKNPEGDYAGRLIDAAGLKKKMIGGAMISPKHANIIVNKDKASSSDILSLMDLAAGKVKEMFNIQLLPEIKVVGEM